MDITPVYGLLPFCKTSWFAWQEQDCFRIFGLFTKGGALLASMKYARIVLIDFSASCSRRRVSQALDTPV